MTILIRETDWDEGNLTVLGQPFHDGDIWAQIARHYQAVYNTAKDTDSAQNMQLFNLGSTPNPVASDGIEPSEAGNWIRQEMAFMCFVWQYITSLLDEQPYSIGGNNYRWGEPGTESAPTPLQVPNDFIELLTPAEILALAFGYPPRNLEFREDWYAAVNTLRGMLDKMQFVYADDTPLTVTLRCEVYNANNTGFGGVVGAVGAGVGPANTFALGSPVANPYLYQYDAWAFPNPSTPPTVTPDPAVGSWWGVPRLSPVTTVRFPNTGNVYLASQFDGWDTPSWPSPYPATYPTTVYFQTGGGGPAILSTWTAFTQTFGLGVTKNPTWGLVITEQQQWTGWNGGNGMPRFKSLAGAISVQDFYSPTGPDWEFTMSPVPSSIYWYAKKIIIRMNEPLPSGKKVSVKVNGSNIGYITPVNSTVTWETPAPPAPVVGSQVVGAWTRGTTYAIPFGKLDSNNAIYPTYDDPGRFYAPSQSLNAKIGKEYLASRTQDWVSAGSSGGSPAGSETYTITGELLDL